MTSFAPIVWSCYCWVDNNHACVSIVTVVNVLKGKVSRALSVRESPQVRRLLWFSQLLWRWTAQLNCLRTMRPYLVASTRVLAYIALVGL